MKLLCTGDIHLGAGTDLGAAPGERLSDQWDVLMKIAVLAADRRVDGVLVAGDIFEGPLIPPEQLEVFADFVALCRGEAIPVLAILGNGKHDAAARQTNGLAIFKHIEGITIGAYPSVHEFAGCAIATLPWVSPSRLIALHGSDVSRDEINDFAAGLLVKIAANWHDEIAKTAPGLPRVLLGHWSVTGTALPNGFPVDQLREPVLDADLLDELGFDHLVFGHIHHAQGFGERGFYVGSPMPLNFGEADDLHGVVILHTDEREHIDFHAAEFVPIKSRPLITLDRDLTQSEGATWDELLGTVPAGAIVRLRYTATRDQHAQIDGAEVRKALFTAGAAVVRVAPTIVREQRARVQGLDEQASELDAFDQWATANDFDPDTAARMRARLAGYLEAA